MKTDIISPPWDTRGRLFRPVEHLKPFHLRILRNFLYFFVINRADVSDLQTIPLLYSLTGLYSWARELDLFSTGWNNNANLRGCAADRLRKYVLKHFEEFRDAESKIVILSFMEYSLRLSHSSKHVFIATYLILKTNLWGRCTMLSPC